MVSISVQQLVIVVDFKKGAQEKNGDISELEKAKTFNFCKSENFQK